MYLRMCHDFVSKSCTTSRSAWSLCPDSEILENTWVIALQHPNQVDPLMEVLGSTNQACHSRVIW